MNEIPRTGLMAFDDGKARCWWCRGSEEYIKYHDEEWGRPSKSERRLFEKVSLEGFQAGLSWLTILKKRENFRKAFRGFHIKDVASFTKKDVKRLLHDKGIVRHKGKIEAVIHNAKKAQELKKEFGTLGAFFWSFEPSVEELPKDMNWEILSNLAKTEHSARMSRELKKREWKFVGPTTMYAFMQSVGIVNDHVEGCYVRDEVERERNKFKRPRIL